METHSSSFACDLRKWREIMQAYETGGHAYHTTMPTDALRTFRDVMLETEAYGFDKVMAEQQELGTKVRRARVARRDLRRRRGLPRQVSSCPTRATLR